SPQSVDELFARGLRADQAVLGAALQASAPMTRAPLLLVLADALQSLSDRLADVGQFHDMACRFKDCVNPPLRTEVSSLTRLLAAIPSSADLPSALGAATPIPAGASWRVVFERLTSQHALLEGAMLDALPGVTAYSPDLFDTQQGASVAPLVTLAR